MKYIRNKIGMLLIALMISSVVVAQKKDRPGKALRENMKAYVKENILPVAVENRRDFESVLSASEKKQIAELRERQQVIRERQKEMRAQFRNTENGAKNSYKLEPTEAQADEMRQVKKERRLIKTEVFTIVDNHEDFFIAMETDLKDDRTKWRDDMKSMMEDSRGEKAKDSDRKEGMRRGGHGKRHHLGGKFNKMFSPVAFVLMDPDNAAMEEQPEDINVFPNPAVSRQTIEIDLKKSGNVKVELIDTDGKTFETLFQGTLSKGQNSIEVDLSGFTGQQYFYKISTPSGTETKRVLLRN
ncbi:MAG: T9SS type A sorting domain-containing protein [Cyclobacteriaceae bacterium]